MEQTQIIKKFPKSYTVIIRSQDRHPNETYYQFSVRLNGLEGIQDDEDTMYELYLDNFHPSYYNNGGVQGHHLTSISTGYITLHLSFRAPFKFSTNGLSSTSFIIPTDDAAGEQIQNFMTRNPILVNKDDIADTLNIELRNDAGNLITPTSVATNFIMKLTLREVFI